jgi:cell division protein FtsB
MPPRLAKIGFALAILFAAGYAFVTLRGPQGLSGLAEKRREIQGLEKRNAALAREIEAKRERINRLRESPSLQELEIRRQLKYMHPEEKVFILQDSRK